METFQTEEQQVEAIKKFWNQYGNSLIIGIVVGLSAFAGYGYYTDKKAAEQVAIAEQYISNTEKNANNTDAFLSSGKKFVDGHSKTAYSTFTALAMAKTVAEKQDWKEAEKFLNLAINSAPNDNIKAVALIRLAKVQTQQKNYTQALATLATPMPESYQSVIEETKGDIYLLQKKPELALTAYQASADAGGLETHPTLQLKIDDLAPSLN